MTALHPTSPTWPTCSAPGGRPDTASTPRSIRSTTSNRSRSRTSASRSSPTSSAPARSDRGPAGAADACRVGILAVPGTGPSRGRAQPPDRCDRARGGHDRRLARRHDRDRTGDHERRIQLDGEVGDRHSSGSSGSGTTRSNTTCAWRPSGCRCSTTCRPGWFARISTESGPVPVRRLRACPLRTLVTSSSSTPSARRSADAEAVCRRSIRPRCWLGAVLTDRALRHRPDRGRPGRRRLCQPGRRAELQRHPHGVAVRRSAARDGRHHDRHPVRFQPAGHQSRQLADRFGGGRRRRRLRCRADEPDSDRFELVEAARARDSDPQDVLRPVRDDVAVRGRRAHRREMGHHPRRHRRLRFRFAATRRPSVGRRPLRRPVHRDRGA